MFMDPGSPGAAVGGVVSLGATVAFDDGATVGTIVAAGAALTGAPVTGAPGAVARGAAVACEAGVAAGALVPSPCSSAGKKFIGRANITTNELSATTRNRTLTTPHVLFSSICALHPE
jgi:hypothetical protein